MHNLTKIIADPLLRWRGTGNLAKRVRNAHRRAVAESVYRRLRRKRAHADVLMGPFQGVVLAEDKPFQVASTATLLGIYESELHEVIDSLPTGKYCQIVVVGAAQGYYAVGLARKFPMTSLILFEADQTVWKALKLNLELNGVSENCAVMARCVPESLGSCLKEGAFVFCDCEGFELHLLDPEKVLQLNSCDMLVELHSEDKSNEKGGARTDVLATIQDRFAATHRIKFINMVSVKSQPTQLLDTLSNDEFRIVCEETRDTSFGWVLLTKKC